MATEGARCRFETLQSALTAFVRNTAGHQGSGHIKPLHWYVACRLVLEGGFHPDDITPRPPFVVQKRNKRLLLTYDEQSAGTGERTILGGLKTKAVDVVVVKEGIGPVIAVSMKGTLQAFRNLTNRMEEAVGDCTNLHIAYPALVYGFLQVMRARRQAEGVHSNDVAVTKTGAIVDGLLRYHDVLARLADRLDVRDVTTRYEAIGLVLVDPDPPLEGQLNPTFPSIDSPLSFARFFEKLYVQYDQRFVYSAPALGKLTRRLQWDAESPALQDARIIGFTPRVFHAGDASNDSDDGLSDE